MVKTMNDDVRILGYCEECGFTITDDMEDYYCDDDGNKFCCNECIMDYYGIHKLEI